MIKSELGTFALELPVLISPRGSTREDARGVSLEICITAVLFKLKMRRYKLHHRALFEIFFLDARTGQESSAQTQLEKREIQLAGHPTQEGAGQATPLTHGVRNRFVFAPV